MLLSSHKKAVRISLHAVPQSAVLIQHLMRSIPVATPTRPKGLFTLKHIKGSEGSANRYENPTTNTPWTKESHELLLLLLLLLCRLLILCHWSGAAREGKCVYLHQLNPGTNFSSRVGRRPLAFVDTCYRTDTEMSGTLCSIYLFTRY